MTHHPLFTDELIHQTCENVAQSLRNRLGPKLRSLYDVDDLRSIALVMAYRLRDRGFPRHEPEYFQGWLFGRLFSIVRNKFALTLKRQNRGYLPASGSDDLPPLPAPHPSHAPEDDFDPDEVQDLVASLGPRESSVVRRLLRGELIDDIAESLGISPHQVKLIAARVARRNNSG